MTGSGDEPLLSLEGVTQRFGSIVALDQVNFALRAGTVHALLGENGAGKTTLMRIAFGMITADAGSVRLRGSTVHFTSPADALRAGLGMVHQHFTLVPTMTVAENVALGGTGRFDPKATASRVSKLAARAGLAIDAQALVSDLSVSAQQRCEILKALSRDVDVLILDEPTAVLAPRESGELLRWIREFVSIGKAVVLITHKLRDALAIADDVTVLRRGAVVLSTTRDVVDEQALASAMLGSGAMDERTPTAAGNNAGTSSGQREVVAHLTNVVVHDHRGVEKIRGASLVVHRGEIVGIAAVEGAGQAELLRVVAGRTSATTGQAHLPELIGFIPEDRHRDALLLDEDLVSNTALRDASVRQGRMRWQTLRDTTVRLLQQFDVRAPGVDTTARSLSGGNQQKLVVGRELMDAPPLLVAENPTRGLDFHATRAVHDDLRLARQSGTAIVFYSSDLDEVLALADRVLVMRDGHLHDVPKDRDAVGRAMLNA